VAVAVLKPQAINLVLVERAVVVKEVIQVLPLLMVVLTPEVVEEVAVELVLLMVPQAVQVS
jgi:hypothetical protein